MFQADSIVTAVSIAFAADANMTAICPGGVWHRRGIAEEQGGERPFAVVTVTPQEDKEFISDQSCIQGFRVAVLIIGDEQTATTGLITSYLCGWDLDRKIFQDLPAKILGFFPQGESLDLDPQEKDGHDVVLASKSWLLVLHYQIGSIPTLST